VTGGAVGKRPDLTSISLKKVDCDAMFNKIGICSTEDVSMSKSARSTGKARNRAIKERSGDERFEAVMKAAERSGLLNRKNGRIAGRVSSALVKQAKKKTGIEGDTDLIAFALANVALEDDFVAAFKSARGKATSDLKLGF
jgi:hypothetical protein